MIRYHDQLTAYCLHLHSQIARETRELYRLAFDTYSIRCLDTGDAFRQPVDLHGHHRYIRFYQGTYLCSFEEATSLSPKWLTHQKEYLAFKIYLLNVMAEEASALHQSACRRTFTKGVTDEEIALQLSESLKEKQTRTPLNPHKDASYKFVVSDV